MHNSIQLVQGPPLIPTSIIWPGQKSIPTNPVYGPLHGTSTWATFVNPGDKKDYGPRPLHGSTHI